MTYKIFCIFTLNLLTTNVLSDLSVSELKDCAQFVNETKLLDLEPSLQARVCSAFLDPEDDNTREQLSPDPPRGRPQPYEVWGYGLLMVTLISITSVVGVGVMPLMSRYVNIILLTMIIEWLQGILLQPPDLSDRPGGGILGGFSCLPSHPLSLQVNS